MTDGCVIQYTQYLILRTTNIAQIDCAQATEKENYYLCRHIYTLPHTKCMTYELSSEQQ